MADRDRQGTPGSGRGGSPGQERGQERSGAFSGERGREAPPGQRGRSEFGGYGAGTGAVGQPRRYEGGAYEGGIYEGRSYGGGTFESGRQGGMQEGGQYGGLHGGGETGGMTGPSGVGWAPAGGYGAGGSGRGMPGRGMAARHRGPKGWQRSDERIHEDVCERLAGEPGIDPSEVTVEVAGGNVMLSGSVPDRGMKYRIEDIVDGCTGVRDVDNRLRVSRGGLGGMLGGGATGMGATTDALASGRDDIRPGGSRGSLLGRLFGFRSGAKLSDIMTRSPRTVGPDETVVKVARLMKELDVGAIPVVTGRTLAGMVTDRDIALRAVAEGKSLDQTRISEVMTDPVHSCYEDEDIEAVLDKMGDLQVRRIPVLDRAEQLVGIVSLGDFAHHETGDVEEALQGISTPT